MDKNKNPLIAEAAIDTVQNVAEAMNELLTLLAHKHSGLCMLMMPMLHALEHVTDNQDTTDGGIEP